MARACDNPKCQYHPLRLPSQLAQFRVSLPARVRPGRQPVFPQKVIDRHKYKDPRNEDEWFLCDDCHKAGVEL